MQHNRQNGLAKQMDGCQEIQGMLNSYVDNELLADETAIVECHLDACQHCQSEVSEIHGLTLAIAQADIPQPSSLRESLFSAANTAICVAVHADLPLLTDDPEHPVWNHVARCTKCQAETQAYQRLSEATAKLTEACPANLRTRIAAATYGAEIRRISIWDLFNVRKSVFAAVACPVLLLAGGFYGIIESRQASLQIAARPEMNHSSRGETHGSPLATTASKSSITESLPSTTKPLALQPLRTPAFKSGNRSYGRYSVPKPSISLAVLPLPEHRSAETTDTQQPWMNTVLVIAQVAENVDTDQGEPKPTKPKEPIRIVKITQGDATNRVSQDINRIISQVARERKTTAFADNSNGDDSRRVAVKLWQVDF